MCCTCLPKGIRYGHLTQNRYFLLEKQATAWLGEMISNSDSHQLHQLFWHTSCVTLAIPLINLKHKLLNLYSTGETLTQQGRSIKHLIQCDPGHRNVLTGDYR